MGDPAYAGKTRPVCREKTHLLPLQSTKKFHYSAPLLPLARTIASTGAHHCFHWRAPLLPLARTFSFHWGAPSVPLGGTMLSTEPHHRWRLRNRGTGGRYLPAKSLDLQRLRPSGSA